ncbi:MAG: M24 family metallopeptidase [Rhodococcus sp. (in: high G+C Gram-positive bacteria)]|nr:MAG: M24 family metallopeptidase [Rhodococcus sp. (in: high G+C Gram-positive bacteria)]
MGFGRKRKVVPFRTAGELDAMAAAGAIVGAALVAVRDAAKPGVSTLELDEVAESVIRDAGAVPSFKGYHGFSGSIWVAHDRKYGIVDGYGGHGIGREMHMEPFLANEGAPGKGPQLVVGSVLAIEPMLTLGTTDTVVLEDDWTVVTSDGTRAAHWEHTVAVTEDGPRILTLRPE